MNIRTSLFACLFLLTGCFRVAPISDGPRELFPVMTLTQDMFRSHTNDQRVAGAIRGVQRCWHKGITTFCMREWEWEDFSAAYIRWLSNPQEYPEPVETFYKHQAGTCRVPYAYYTTRKRVRCERSRVISVTIGIGTKGARYRH